MVRAIVGTILTLAGLVFDPTVGTAIGVVSALWVVMGIGAVINVAAARPTEHRIQLLGEVAHVVVEPPRRAAPQQMATRASFIECPVCSAFLGPSSNACSCGWSARSVIEPAAGRSLEAPKQRVCPACPQCRAPTGWVGEFERFFCQRCDVYV